MNSTSTNASEPNKRARPCARQAAGRQHRQPGRDQAPPASAASTSRAPAKQTRPPAKIPNARGFSSPPLIAIHPLLYPPPARRRVLPAQTRTFAGSRAQKLIRCDAFFSFPAGPGEKMEGGQKIWNAHAGGGARGKRNASGREIGTGIIFAASRKWWKELARRKLLGRTDGPHAGGGALRRGGDLVRGGAFCSGGLGFWYAWEKYFSELATFAGFPCYIDIVQ